MVILRIEKLNLNAITSIVVEFLTICVIADGILVIGLLVFGR